MNGAEGRGRTDMILLSQDFELFKHFFILYHLVLFLIS